RSRPDVVATWDDTEVARRWLLLCPVRKSKDGKPEVPNEFELNSIRHDAERLAKIRTRLSDISWWMRLLCQNIAQRANREDGEVGKFFQARFRAVRILDDESLLACAAYVDLNPIRAALAETLEQSDFTSVQRRIQSLPQSSDGSLPQIGAGSRDCFLAPLAIDLSAAGRPTAASTPRARPARCLLRLAALNLCQLRRAVASVLWNIAHSPRSLGAPAAFEAFQSMIANCRYVI
ncbi:MAG TPA: hypothetical protein VMM76_12860, partial [Pirellulaceae bacterium]|nr:hypothetical protein [Pirellulaceae bacterium]